MIKDPKENKSNKDHWEEYLKDPRDIVDKENLEIKKRKNLIFKFDLHGYSIENANKKVEELIFDCHRNGYKEILVITGKGMHSKKVNDVYSSSKYSTLRNTVKEYIQNNAILKSKIKKIVEAPKNFGGEGAFIIKLSVL